MKNKKETNPALPQYVLAVKEIKNAIIDSRYRAARQELPGLTGFSETNIKNMRIFYEAWYQILDNQSISYSSINDIKFNDLLNQQTSSADLSDKDWECFLSIGFSNHREIIRKTSTLEERLFYIRRCAKEFWNVETTKYHLKEDLYHKGLMTND